MTHSGPLSAQPVARRLIAPDSMRARGVSSVQGRAGWARARACAGRSRGAASVNPRGAMPCTAEMQGDLPSVLQLAAAALQGAGAASGRLGSGGIPQPASRQSPAHVRSGWCPWLSRARWACWAGQQQAQASGLRQQRQQRQQGSGRPPVVQALCHARVSSAIARQPSSSAASSRPRLPHSGTLQMGRLGVSLAPRPWAIKRRRAGQRQAGPCRVERTIG